MLRGDDGPCRVRCRGGCGQPDDVRYDPPDRRGRGALHTAGRHRDGERKRRPNVCRGRRGVRDVLRLLQRDMRQPGVQLVRGKRRVVCRRRGVLQRADLLQRDVRELHERWLRVHARLRLLLEHLQLGRVPDVRLGWLGADPRRIAAAAARARTAHAATRLADRAREMATAAAERRAPRACAACWHRVRPARAPHSAAAGSRVPRGWSPRRRGPRRRMSSAASSYQATRTARRAQTAAITRTGSPAGRVCVSCPSETCAPSSPSAQAVSPARPSARRWCAAMPPARCARRQPRASSARATAACAAARA
jgi:hypothetical protein